MRGLLILAALAFSPITALFAAEPQAASDKPLSRAELKTAVEKGEKVVGREIKGEDIAAVLAPFIKPANTCAPNGGLHLEKSTIRGDISLEFKAPVKAPPTKTPSAKPTSAQSTEETPDDDTDDDPPAF